MNRQDGFTVSSPAYYAACACDHFHLDFKNRCRENLERLGDGAMDNQKHDEAIKYYSSALSVYPPDTQRFFILRSKVGMAKSLWEDAVEDANEVSSIVSRKYLRWYRHNHQAIALDTSSPWGYGTKRAVLHRAGRYEEAIQTFETMLSKMEQSSDPQIRRRLHS